MIDPTVQTEWRDTTSGVALAEAAAASSRRRDRPSAALLASNAAALLLAVAAGTLWPAETLVRVVNALS